MHAVLYTHQLEPITVVDIPAFLWDMLRSGQSIRLAVPMPMKFAARPAPPEIEEMKTVTIFGEPIRRQGHEALMLFTADEESALLLRAEFLPGQRGELQGRERSAFAQGFMHAIHNFGG